MDRALHYEIHCDPQHFEDTRAEIDRTTTAMNRSFTWTSDALFIEPLTPEERREREAEIPLGAPAPVAHGYVKVRDDEWNAMLIFCFTLWLSRRVPEATVRLRDDGDLVLARYLSMRAGAVSLTRSHVLRHAAQLESRQELARLARYRRHIMAGQYGTFLRRVPASAYADRREIAALGLHARTLTMMDLTEVASLVRFPWSGTERADR